MKVMGNEEGVSSYWMALRKEKDTVNWRRRTRSHPV